MLFAIRYELLRINKIKRGKGTMGNGAGTIALCNDLVGKGITGNR